jgi:hypothetical protein
MLWDLDLESSSSTASVRKTTRGANRVGVPYAP